MGALVMMKTMRALTPMGPLNQQMMMIRKSLQRRGKARHQLHWHLIVWKGLGRKSCKLSMRRNWNLLVMNPNLVSPFDESDSSFYTEDIDRII